MIFLFQLILVSMLCSCEKSIDIRLEAGPQQIVVEAYINNIFPQYNYVILSRSQDYYSTNLLNIPVANATVTITEGSRDTLGNYVWDASTKLQLRESRQDSIPEEFSIGMYYDQRAYTDRQHALRGTIGKSYLLEISSEGKDYSAITSLSRPVIN